MLRAPFTGRAQSRILRDMSQIVNLNKARKARGKAQKTAQANENAVKFGRSKAEKQRAAMQAARDETRLDGHKREP